MIRAHARAVCKAKYPVLHKLVEDVEIIPSVGRGYELRMDFTGDLHLVVVLNGPHPVELAVESALHELNRAVLQKLGEVRSK